MSLPTALPASTAAPLRGGPVLRFGVIGAGEIAAAFTTSLHEHGDQRVVLVASRSADRAQRFARETGVDRSTDSYEALVADPEVDIVYVATTNNLHLDHALLAIAAGKHVLVEKPMALDAAQTREIVEAARAAGVFAMEAMWTRFLPKTTVIAQLLADGVLGEVKQVSATLGFRFPQRPDSRIFDPALGGGALLDLGVYTMWWNHFALGAPEGMTVRGMLGPTGVDDQSVLTLEYTGAQGLAVTSAVAQLHNVGTIAGTEGLIVAPSFLGPDGFALIAGDERLEFEDPSGLTWRQGLGWQAAAVAQHIADGRTEAPEHPLDRSIAIAENLERARTALGYA